MITVNTIIKELKDVPVNRLEELYNFISSLTSSEKSTKNKKKILSYSGALSTMTDEDFTQFIENTKSSRNQLFNREIEK